MISQSVSAYCPQWCGSFFKQDKRLLALAGVTAIVVGIAIYFFIRFPHLTPSIWGAAASKPQIDTTKAAPQVTQLPIQLKINGFKASSYTVEIKPDTTMYDLMRMIGDKRNAEKQTKGKKFAAFDDIEFTVNIPLGQQTEKARHGPFDERDEFIPIYPFISSIKPDLDQKACLVVWSKKTNGASKETIKAISEILLAGDKTLLPAFTPGQNDQETLNQFRASLNTHCKSVMAQKPIANQSVDALERVYKLCEKETRNLTLQSPVQNYFEKLAWSINTVIEACKAKMTS